MTPTHHVHWSYEGDTGPAHWGDLAPEYALCAQGTAQTPIDITPTENQALSNPVVRYHRGDVTVVNNGHTIQANSAPGNSIVVDNIEYALAQMHFHAPSEHTIDGTPAQAEVHFVHKATDGSLTVIGALIQVGDDNPAWTPYINAFDTAVDTSTTITLDWTALLPNDLMTYRYRGSLTTPPCSEGVNWMVLQTPITLSDAQIAAFTAAYDGNARPIQADNHRTVIVDSSDS
jgi:carbonic anhydrase